MPESLSIIAELGIGLAGFAGVVVALGARERGLDAADRRRLVGLLLSALGAALMAPLPTVVVDAGVDSQTVWRSSSAVFAVYVLGFLISGLWVSRAIPKSPRAVLHPSMWVLYIGGCSVVAILLGWNVVRWSGEATPGPYLASFYYLLFTSAVGFARILFVRPA